MAKTMRAILGDIYDAWRKQNFDWLGSYLPDDLCHVIYIPVELHPLGGTRLRQEGGARPLAAHRGAIPFRRDRHERSADREEPRRGGSADTLAPPGNRRAVRIDQVEFLDAGRRLAGEAHRVPRHRARSGLRQRRRRRPPGMTGMKEAPYRPPCSAASSSGVG